MVDRWISVWFAPSGALLSGEGSPRADDAVLPDHLGLPLAPDLIGLAVA